MSTVAAPRLDALTGVRIFAAAAVFLSHLPSMPGASGPLHAFQYSGYSGVTLFFMLSGFILTWNYEARLGDRLQLRELWSFYVARFARVYPLYLFALTLVLLEDSPNAGAFLKLLAEPLTWLHVGVLQTWSPNLFVAFGLNGPAWSIGIEVFLYALFPFLLLFVRLVRGSVRAIAILIGVSILVATLLWLFFEITGRGHLDGADPESAYRWLYRTPLTRIPDFMVGIGIALLIRKVPASDSTKVAGSVLAIGGAVCVLGFMVTPALLFSSPSWDVLYMIPSAFIILGLAWAPEGPLARVLSTRLLVLLGEASYAFYILHVVVLNLIAYPSPSASGWIIASTVRLVLVCCVAVGAHYLVERPARVLLRRLLDHRRMPQPAVAAP